MMGYDFNATQFNHDSLSSIVASKYLHENKDLWRFAISSAFILLILCPIANLLLLLFLGKEKKAGHFAPTQVVVVAMAGLATVVSPLGLSSTLVVVMSEPKDLLFCIFENVSLTAVMFSFGSNLHLATYMQFARYKSIISGQLSRHNRNTVKVIVLLLILYSFVTAVVGVLPKTLMDFELLSRRSLARRIIPVSFITLWLVPCTVAMATLTRLIIKEIRRRQNETRDVLRHQTRAIDTKPLQMNYVSAILYILIWVPYGSVVIMKPLFDVEIYSYIFIFCTIYAHMSLLVLPTLYYFMDKRFERYFKRLIGQLKTRPFKTVNRSVVSTSSVVNYKNSTP